MGGYNFNKIKGLTSKDREKWEKDNLDVLMYDDNNYLQKSEQDKDILFKNYAFKEKFKNDPNYEKYKTLDISQRDSIYIKSLGQTKESPSIISRIKSTIMPETPLSPVKESEKIDYNTSVNANDFNTKYNKTLGEVKINPANIKKPLNQAEVIGKELVNTIDNIVNDPKTKKYQEELPERKKIYRTD